MYSNPHFFTCWGETFVSTLLPEKNIHQLDLTDTQATTSLLKKLQPTHIFHLAATAVVGGSFDELKKTVENNFNIQLNLLEAVKQHSPQARVLSIGSALEYQTGVTETFSESTPLGPSSPYAFSKVLQDMLSYMYSQTEKLDIIRVRPFNHIGERQAPGFVVSDFAQQIVRIEQGNQTSIQVGNLEAVRDFTDVKDICQAYILLMDKGTAGEVYNIGSGRGISIQSLLDQLIALSETQVIVETDPEKFRPVDVKTVIAESSKIQKLGWKPKIALENTLERVLEYYRNSLRE